MTEPPFNGDLHQAVVDRLGTQIASGEIPAGAVLVADRLQAAYGVSRSVMREAVRVLASLGMVASRRKVGLIVRPIDRWSLFAPQVIRWRLATPSRISQFRSLTELRAAIEPEAARLAATRAHLTQAANLMTIAARLWAAGKAGDEAGFLAADIQFHSLVLASSGNEMFASLSSAIEEILVSRVRVGLHPSHPSDAAMQHHFDVVTAIQAGHPDDAQRAMTRIVVQAMEEMSSIWEALPAAPEMGLIEGG